ncbi:MAG: hypothetical protein WCJ33_00635 [Pseudomonadota bacterium]
MTSLPIPRKLSLADSLFYIAKQANNGKMSLDVQASFHDALREGNLTVHAQKLNEDSDTSVLEVIPIAFLQELDENEISHFCLSSGTHHFDYRIEDTIPQYRNSFILTADIDNWLVTNTDSKLEIIEDENNSLKSTENSRNNVFIDNPEKEKAFNLLKYEIGDKKINRTFIKDWCSKHGVSVTWGYDFITQLPAENKNPRGRPRKK